ncbi:MAG: hypothetical protein JWP61_1126 [Friedmanniella sp.]|jgi:hypothetical protein|nr:hypothetical protein [Friedmanniella sp.]
MTGATGSGGRPSGGSAGSHHGGQHGEGRDLWPREFGRDGVSGLVSADRAMRARDVSRPGPEDEAMAEQVVAGLLARIDGRRGTPAGRGR